MPAQPARKPVYTVPADHEQGHCTVCGAGFREYSGCEQPDCNFVREERTDDTKPR